MTTTAATRRCLAASFAAHLSDSVSRGSINASQSLPPTRGGVYTPRALGGLIIVWAKYLQRHGPRAQIPWVPRESGYRGHLAQVQIFPTPSQSPERTSPRCLDHDCCAVQRMNHRGDVAVKQMAIGPQSPPDKATEPALDDHRTQMLVDEMISRTLPAHSGPDALCYLHRSCAPATQSLPLMLHASWLQ